MFNCLVFTFLSHLSLQCVCVSKWASIQCYFYIFDLWIGKRLVQYIEICITILWNLALMVITRIDDSVLYIVLSVIVIHYFIVCASKQRNGIATCNIKNLVWNASGNVVHLDVLSLSDLVYVAACIRQWILFGKKKSSYVLI